MKKILKKLFEYSKMGRYPFHMPGHKRNRRGLSELLPYELDITEIDGFDDLHHPEGLLKEAMEKAAEVFSCDYCWYLVNGSTAGNLTAVSAAADPGDTVIVARNCHKSIYHALYLRNLHPVYIYPEVIDAYGIYREVDPEKIRKALQEHPEAKAVILTSPTYEGMVSDIQTIADICHQARAALIVDEAHGAHFGFDEAFPKSAISLGADLVINSLHKTLPSLTQTAILKYCDHHIGLDIKKIEKFLSIYQSSSPSYILMASIDECVGMMELVKNGKEPKHLMEQYVENLRTFYQNMQSLQMLSVMGTSFFEEERTSLSRDPSKIVISLKKSGMGTGNALAQILRKVYHLEMEMSGPDYTLAMTSMMDSKEGFERLQAALIEIDERMQKEGEAIFLPYMEKEPEEDQIRKRILDLQGKESQDFVYVYPPGIPVLAPGEVCTRKEVDTLLGYLEEGLKIHMK